MTPTELDQLVAQIGDELLTRAQPARLRRGEGLNVDAEVCPDCTQRCVQTCARKAHAIVGAGAARVSASETLTRVDAGIAGLIDHTILKPDATAAEIERVCAEARQYGFASVCVNPYWVAKVAALLRDSPVKVCTVVGFPLGATTTEAKVAETEVALRCGAQEIDMVQNVGALKSGDAEHVRQDIAAVAAAARPAGAVVKVILETSLLSDEEKAIACTMAKMAGAGFVKTSTGFSSAGATAHDVALMRSIVGLEMGVKASGGIRTRGDLETMTHAGATRIGASASVKIVAGDAGAARSGASY